MELYNKYKTILNSANINTPLRLAHFFGQLDYESKLKPVRENLRYSSASRILEIFGKYITKDEVDKFVNNAVALGSRVYANRMGNGPEETKEGWIFLGRGFIQLTGKNNYKALSDYTGIDYVSNPNLLLNEADSMVAAIWFWTINNLNSYADLDDIKSITKKINGGYTGLSIREIRVNKYKKIFK